MWWMFCWVKPCRAQLSIKAINMDDILYHGTKLSRIPSPLFTLPIRIDLKQPYQWQPRIPPHGLRSIHTGHPLAVVQVGMTGLPSQPALQKRELATTLEEMLSRHRNSAGPSPAQPSPGPAQLTAYNRCYVGSGLSWNRWTPPLDRARIVTVHSRIRWRILLSSSLSLLKAMESTIVRSRFWNRDRPMELEKHVDRSRPWLGDDSKRFVQTGLGVVDGLECVRPMGCPSRRARICRRGRN